MSIPRTILTTIVAVASITVAVVAIAILYQPKQEQPAVPKQPAVSDLTVDNLLREVNKERTKAGVGALEADPLLNKSAQLKADEIEKTGVFEHVGKTGKRGITYINEAGVNCVWQAEDLAADTSSRGTVEDWLGSKAHRESILNGRYETGGFGISDGPGYSYLVLHMCDRP